MRKLAIILLLFLLAAGYAWYSMRAMPSWFDQSEEQPHNQNINDLFGDKVADVIKGEVNFNEAEFNSIFVASLQNDVEGQKLLQVSDAVRAFIHADKIELSAIINLNKVESVDPGARKAIEQFDRIFPFIDGHQVALTVYATPVVRGGMVGIKDDFYIKVGALPFTNSTLRGLGVEVERANTTNLALKYLDVASLQLAEELITLNVRPRF